MCCEETSKISIQELEDRGNFQDQSPLHNKRDNGFQFTPPEMAVIRFTPKNLESNSKYSTKLFFASIDISF